MCQQLKIFAKSNEHRFIIGCEHGIFHITWDIVTLSLNQHRFEQLYQLTRRTLPCRQAPIELRQQECRVIRFQEQDDYQITINRIGIELSPIDYPIFVSLLHSAWVNYKHVSTNNTFKSLQNSTLASAYMVFSNN